MHEVGIVRSALEAAVHAAERASANRIVRIRLRVGAMAGVVPDAMDFAFEALSVGTMAEGAVLECETVPLRCRCVSGCPEFEPTGAVFECPVCGKFSSELLQGRELELAQVEVED